MSYFLFSVEVAKYPHKSYLGRGSVYFISQLQVPAHYCREGKAAGTKAASLVHSQEQREDPAVLSPAQGLHFYIHLGTSAAHC